MALRSSSCLLALLLLAGSASAVTVGPLKGKPAPGRPLEVNIPVAMDDPADRACASANVRYGNVPVPRSTLHVQGQGLKRNLLVTSRAPVDDRPVTVNVRVGCGAKSVTRSFVMQTGKPVARNAPAPEPKEPLFPPPAPETTPPESDVQKVEAAMMEELRKARTAAATAIAQLGATRKELDAVLDVVRRTSQSLITADHEIRAARSEATRMRMILVWIGSGLGLVAAGLVWLEFNRLAFRRRISKVEPAQEPILSGMEVAA